MPFALTLCSAATQTLARTLRNVESAQRLVLSLFFRAALGVQRIFHFETLDDVGFAILTGGKRVLSRTRLGGLVRAPRRPAYVQAWKALPRSAFCIVDEPGRFVGAKPKRIEITETTTAIRGLSKPIRTIVVREHAKRGKDRWHALFILHDDTTPPLDLVHEFRTRQHHEQSYRMGVHDLALDTVPSGDPKRGLPDRPGFQQGPLHLCSWIVALVSEAELQLSALLPPAFHRCHPRTLRRWVLERDAELYLTPSHLLVVLTFIPGRSLLRPLLQRFNEANVALPWLGGRHVAIGFAATRSHIHDAKPVLNLSEVGSGRSNACASVWC